MKVLSIICCITFLFSSSTLAHASTMRNFVDEQIGKEHNNELHHTTQNHHDCHKQDTNSDEGSCIEHCIGQYSTIVLIASHKFPEEIVADNGCDSFSLSYNLEEGNEGINENQLRGPPERTPTTPYHHYVGITIIVI